MPEVVIADRLLERVYIQVVVDAAGVLTQVNPGYLPDPSHTLLATTEAEPTFSVRLAEPVHEDVDLPDAVGLALRRAAQQFYGLTPEGVEAPSDPAVHPVENVRGPVVSNGEVLISVDTDGRGVSQQVLDAMATVLAEELSAVEAAAFISIPEWPTNWTHDWLSSSERTQGKAPAIGPSST